MFSHQCLSATDATAARARELSELQRGDGTRSATRLAEISPTLLNELSLVAGAVVIGSLSVWFLHPSAGLLWLSGLSTVVAVVVMVVTLAAADRRAALANAKAAIFATYKPASTEDLQWLVRLCEAHADVGAAVAQWLREDKTILERDLRAVRAYACDADPRAARAKVLAELSAAAGKSASNEDK
ncbi:MULTISPECIES: hypothetical protein [Pseudomonadota]|uniref:Uncharacterized protein n=1 Tax=Rhodanobacter denitrificans TaxID=666685 RepID=M4NE64_9GAMM|nr:MULTISPECIES: hypothetical protein [Pseudomonadota]AGG89075.1 hypothetical protein R2APBS1_1952 [Rhodanobacter denitrificans]TAN24998.1 MAG: hypothetical protein EPN31_16295 [Castellaniella sp.]UJJ53102.1 hypothetical protein LRK52_18525 [Rhodanobacter denitrificans]